MCRHYVWGWNNKIQSSVVDDRLAKEFFLKAVLNIVGKTFGGAGMAEW